MYKRPRPRSSPIIPSPKPGGLGSQASGLGWEKWNFKPIQVLDDVEHESHADEPEPSVDMQALEAERQARELEAIREAARAEGYAAGVDAGRLAGYEQGFEQGQQEGHAQAQEVARVALSEKVAILEAMINQSRDELTRLQSEVGQSLVHLGVRVAEHVLGHAIKRPAPSALATVREVLRQNDEPGENLTVWLHPLDLKAIEEDVNALPTLSTVRLLADDSLTRGGVVVRTAHGDIDATLQTRWKAALASIGYRQQNNEEA